MIHKVLVVNDDSMVLFVTCKVIMNTKFADETVTARDGSEALAYFEKIAVSGNADFKEVPDFIFLDLNMPNMNGWDFLDIFSKKYAERFPGVRVAIMSSSNDRKELDELQKYNIVLDFIENPISKGKLELIKDKFLKVQMACFPENCTA